MSNITSIYVHFTSNNTNVDNGYIIVMETAVTLISNICFRHNTPILTDQGLYEISNIDTKYHTIRGKEIKQVTKTISLGKYLVLVEKDSLYKNVPSNNTIMTIEHCILYNGKMLAIKNFVNNKTILYIKNTGEVLYNILLETQDVMMVNNMICETLHPDNFTSGIINKIQHMDNIEKNTLIKAINYKIISDHMYY